MEALHVHLFDASGATSGTRGSRSARGDAGMEASSPTGSTTEEETDEDSEPEPPPIIRRKVSFADAFGLNLVSVKEFDNVEVTESEVSWSKRREVTRLADEFHLSCLFAVPSTPEELDRKLHAQMIELESIELLPGTSTLRGIVRVLNLCYCKSVYARMSLDRWRSYFDLLAEYIPGSSDRKTDKFAFMYTLVPPFETGGARIEFCLRYETPQGAFWANNGDMNYVLFCHQKGQTSVAQTDEESIGYRSKRSCLKANRNEDAEEKNKEVSNTSILAAAEVEGALKLETTNSAETPLHKQEHKPRVESVKSRRRATRLARVKDYLSKTMRQQVNDSAHDRGASQPMPAPWADSGGLPYERQTMQSSESPQVLTYHQIPLLPLDWNNEAPLRCETAGADDIWAARPKMTLPNSSEEKLINDTWETPDEASSNERSVSDVWQAFLNGPSCEDHSDVSESEWLQTAALVSPSNDREPQTQRSAESREFQNATAASHALAACQPLSDTCEPLSAVVALNAKDHQSEEACVSSSGDDNAATQAASQRSQTNSVTDTPLEFSLKRAPPVSGDADSPTECHEQEVWERECGGIIAAGIGGGEPFTLRTADLVTSSRESETTDTTAMPESHNGNPSDMISEGARQDEGLSSSGDFAATADNAGDDILLFRKTIGQETKDGERTVFSVSTQEVEEYITISYIENKELFRPETEKRLTLEARGTCIQKKEYIALAVMEERADLKSETGEHAFDSNLTEDGNRSSCDGEAMERKGMSPPKQFRPVEDTMDWKKTFQIGHDLPRHGPIDKCSPKPLEEVELKWMHSKRDLKTQNDHLSSEISPEDVKTQKNAPKRETSTEHHNEASSGAEDDLSQDDKSVAIGKLKMESMREMICNVESPQMNAWKEQELSAEVESSQTGECKKPSIGTKDPITAVNSAAPEVAEPGMERVVIERFGEDLLSKIWEDIFVREVQTSSGRTNTVDEVRNVTDAVQGCHFLFEEGTLDSGVFSLSELPTGLNLSLGRAIERTWTESNACSTQDKSEDLEATRKTLILNHLRTGLGSSPHLSQELTTTLAAQVGEPWFQSTQAPSSPTDQGNCSQIKARLDMGQETESQTENCVFTCRKSSDRPTSCSNKHLRSSEKLKEPDALLWWTVLYTISHLTRLLICTLMVGGFFFVVFLYDFPAFFAFYLFSICWWVYTWKRHRVTADNRITG